MSTCAILSFRLGLTDGVSIVAESWRQILTDIGFDVVTIAGEGPVDHVVPGLAMEATVPPSTGEIEAVLAGVDLVVVENLCTIPLNPAAAHVVADMLRGRPALLHHHDPPWQRVHFAHVTDLPPVDPAWRHVTINRLTEAQFAERGIPATTIYNGFDTRLAEGDRGAARRALDVDDDELLVIHPVRAIGRKGVAEAIALTEALGGTYWLLGPAEFGFGPELERLKAEATCRIIHRPHVHDAGLYLGPDLVAFPSTWEGFGNPPVEAALQRIPAAVGPYPVGQELRSLGFHWLDAADHDAVARVVADPDPAVLDHDRALAIEHFSLDRVAESLRDLLDEAGWVP